MNDNLFFNNVTSETDTGYGYTVDNIDTDWDGGDLTWVHTSY